MSFTLKLTPIYEIGEYIRERSNTDTAKSVVEEIFKAISTLVRFPHQGHRRTDLTSRPLRFWRVYDYLIAYAPDERPLVGRRGPAWSP